MRANVKLLRKQRQFTDEFKKKIVSEFESGKFSIGQLEKLHNISNPTLYSWIHKFTSLWQMAFSLCLKNQFNNSFIQQLKQFHKFKIK
jgi:hypothetical protein